MRITVLFFIQAVSVRVRVCYICMAELEKLAMSGYGEGKGVNDTHSCRGSLACQGMEKEKTSIIPRNPVLSGYGEGKSKYYTQKSWPVRVWRRKKQVLYPESLRCQGMERGKARFIPRKLALSGYGERKSKIYTQKASPVRVWRGKKQVLYPEILACQGMEKEKE